MLRNSCIYLLSILVATNIIIIAESFCPICLLILATTTGYSDLSVLVVENLIVQGSLILFAKYMGKSIPFNRYQIILSDLFAWASFILYIRILDCGNHISKLPGSLYVERLCSFSSQLGWASSFILYTVILLFVECIFCVLLYKKINIKSGFYKKSVLLIFVAACLILIFNGKGIEAMFNPQSISLDVYGPDINVKVEKDSGRIFVKLSKLNAADRSEESIFQFFPRGKGNDYFNFDLRNDTMYVCSHIFKVKTIKKGKIAMSDNCPSCIPPEILKQQRRVTCKFQTHPLDLYYNYK